MKIKTPIKAGDLMSNQSGTLLRGASTAHNAKSSPKPWSDARAAESNCPRERRSPKLSPDYELSRITKALILFVHPERLFLTDW